MTATLVDNDIVVLEEHEFEAGCDIVFTSKRQCERPARWTVFKSCCGNVTLWCDVCKDEIIACEDIALDCLRPECGAVHAPARHMVLYMEPLRRKS